MIYQKLLDLPKQTKDKNKIFIGKLKRGKVKKIDDIFHQKHEEVFENIDCLQCGNCCKTTSPVFREIDIRRISKKLRVKAVDFIEEYLYEDRDGDYVLNFAPCPFLDLDDNTCGIYDYRPQACEEYPHTNRKNMYQILDLTLKNTEVCPAVSQIVTEMQKGIDLNKKVFKG